MKSRLYTKNSSDIMKVSDQGQFDDITTRFIKYSAKKEVAHAKRC